MWQEMDDEVLQLDYTPEDDEMNQSCESDIGKQLGSVSLENDDNFFFFAIDGKLFKISKQPTESELQYFLENTKWVVDDLPDITQFIPESKYRSRKFVDKLGAGELFAFAGFGFDNTIKNGCVSNIAVFTYQGNCLARVEVARLTLSSNPSIAYDAFKSFDTTPVFYNTRDNSNVDQMFKAKNILPILNNLNLKNIGSDWFINGRNSGYGDLRTSQIIPSSVVHVAKMANRIMYDGLKYEIRRVPPKFRQQLVGLVSQHQNDPTIVGTYRCNQVQVTIKLNTQQYNNPHKRRRNDPSHTLYRPQTPPRYRPQTPPMTKYGAY
jgi:hypothetical protein